MIDPKTFYRELDTVLAKIGAAKSDENFFFSILNELQQRFGQTLNIRKNHLYEMRGESFVRICPPEETGIDRHCKVIKVDTEAIQMVIKHGSYIYDDGKWQRTFRLKGSSDPMTPASIYIHSPEGQWMFVFELLSPWSREEILLFLNAVRTAINYRLFSVMMGSELERAVQIQRSLLPKKSPDVKGYQIYGHSQAAELVGGDFYEYFQFEDSTFGVSVGDASGHGLPAALLVRDVVIGLRMGLAKEMRLAHTLKKLNQVIQRSTYSTNFVSLFIGEIESDGHLFYVNAGHPPPFLVTKTNIHDLEATGITLGFMQDIELTRSYIHLEPNSILVMYTDGIIERVNSREEQFGLDGLKDFVLRNCDKTAKEIVELTYKKVFDFANRTSWQDDATMVVIKRSAE